MKFPRNARMLRYQLDAAPFAGVLFCALIFVLLCSLVYTPGVQIQLPASSTPAPGVDGPKIAVALDPNGNYYYENQLIPEADLIKRLKIEAARQPEPLTLVVAADETVTLKQLSHVGDIAASAGIRIIKQQTQSRMFEAPVDGVKKP